VGHSKISPDELESLLIAQANATFVGATMLTKPLVRLSRTRSPLEIYRRLGARQLEVANTNPHFKRIHKVSILTGTIKFSFQSVVRRAQASRGERATFLAKARRWGQQLRDTPIIYHTVDGDDRVYMHVLINRRHDHYFHTETAERLDYETQVWPFERIRKRPRHGVDNYREFTLTNVAELRSRGQSMAVYPCRTFVDRYLPTAS
jgi:hypothetical protein